MKYCFFIDAFILKKNSSKEERDFLLNKILNNHKVFRY